MGCSLPSETNMPAKKQTPPVKLTLDQQIQAAIDSGRSLEEYAIQHLPIPATVPSVGDEVYLGHLDDAIVVAVVDEGRRVAVRHTPARTRSDSAPLEKVVRVVPTFEVQKKCDASQDNFSTPNHYQLNYSQRDVSGLLTMLTAFGVDMNPSYQRELVWDEADKVRLIDSIFNQVDIGKFVFRKLPFESDGPGYEIVDGKQRLNALMDFMCDKFAYKGKTWSELSRADRNYIEGYSVSYAQLSETYTDKQIMDLFVRLNTGGKPMDPKHLEKVAKMAEDTPVVRASSPKR